ncbi:hypothetical protein PhCBS80983_g03180 [Powellomyces hirtus]|uniref:HIG1 domain-containing protein n=1 Tax=Powellomyces hirtus TaxID=109895 RepID=A0A507E3R4_9FUNG|nr:hypothetical protein PhCBS80983_g03180 [Powellomyces hirtus]
MSQPSPSQEGFWARSKRKNEENPFILPAVGLVIYSLYKMSASLLRNDRVGFQQSQRMRVGSQILALAAFSGGMM